MDGKYISTQSAMIKLPTKAKVWKVAFEVVSVTFFLYAIGVLSSIGEPGLGDSLSSGNPAHWSSATFSALCIAWIVMNAALAAIEYKAARHSRRQAPEKHDRDSQIWP